MKSTLLFISLLILTSSFAQVKNMGMQYNDKDTTRTLGFMYENVDSQLDKLVKKLGNPDYKSAGNYLWKSYKFPFLAKEVDISIADGIWTQKSNMSSFATFANEKEKAAFKNDIKTGTRCTHIEILYKNKNIINSKRLETQFLDYFNQLLSE